MEWNERRWKIEYCKSPESPPAILSHPLKIDSGEDHFFTLIFHLSLSLSLSRAQPTLSLSLSLSLSLQSTAKRYNIRKETMLLGKVYTGKTEPDSISRCKLR
jgi:hypothetical protein